MPEVNLPATLPPLFDGLPRTVEVEPGTVSEAIDELEREWPGVFDRLCLPGPRLRPHLNAYVDREPADLGTPLKVGSRLDLITAISGG